MKNALRIGIMFLLSVALCMCFAGSAFAEEFILSDDETYDAHGVYVNEENFPDEYFRQYVLNNYGTYLSSGEIASAKIIDCTNNNYWYDDPNDGNTQETWINVPEGYTSYIGEDGITYYVDTVGNTYVLDTDGNLVLCVPITPVNWINVPEGYTSYIGEDGITYYVDTVGNTYVLDTDGNLVLCVPKNPENDQDHSTDDEVYTPPYDPSEGEPFIVGSYGFVSSDSESFGSEDGTDNRVKSLKGIEYFTELEELYCARNALSVIDLSKNTALKHLDCSNNKLLSLDVSGNKELTSLVCSYNQLTNLDLCSNVELQYIQCDNNQITELDLRNNTALATLSCTENRLTTLDLSSNRALESLYCYKNQLTALDLSENPFVRSIYCENNAITSLNLSNKNYLQTLSGANNQINYLNIEECPILMRLTAEDEPDSYNGELRYYTGWGYFGGRAELVVDETVKLIPVNCHSINDTNFPDERFQQYVLETFDTDGDSYLCKDEIEAAIEMDCSGLGIQKLNGLEFFYNLKKLNCSDNNIECLTIGQSADLLDMIGRVQPEVTENRVSYTDTDTYLIYDADTVLMDAVHPKWIINKTNFPDAFFRDYISNNIDLNLDGFLNEEEIAAVTWIDCSGNGEDRGSIVSLQGVELFANLEMLDCSYNRISTLDVSNNPKLKTLDCSINQLTGYLDVTSNPALETLWCYSNWLEDVDLGNNENLIELWCNDNQLMALDITGLPGLKVLWCDANKLTDLDTTGNPALEILCCANNKLENLDLSQNSALRTLWCFENKIEELNLFNNPDLNALGCYANYMSVLDIAPCYTLCELAANRPYSERDGAIYYYDESSTDPAYLQYDIGTTLITSHTPDLILPSFLTTIEDEAFAGGAFKYVMLPDGVKTIGWHAFVDCPNLLYIYIPEGIESIDAHAFDGADRLTIISTPGSEAESYARLHGFAFKAAE